MDYLKTDTNSVTQILDALECAKEALALLPQLPPHIKPVFFRILNALYIIRDDNGNACISDISKESGLLLPNTTKFISEMAELNIVKKSSSISDKRVVLVQATPIGEQYIENYILSFHKSLAMEFSNISESDRLTTIKTIEKVYQAMKRSLLTNSC